MRLSEAIRLGSMMYPAAYGPTFTFDAAGEICGVCALGAAAIGGGFQIKEHSYWPAALWLEIGQKFPLLSAVVENPVYRGSRACVRQIVVYLFESRRWTLEAIANWVETIEMMQEQEQSCLTTKSLQTV